VYKAYQKYRDPNTGQKTLHRVVALKEVKMKESISKKAYKEVINEVEMMKRITHPNIIQLYDSFIDR
jgi:serine/threonine protein kinase